MAKPPRGGLLSPVPELSPGQVRSLAAPPALRSGTVRQLLSLPVTLAVALSACGPRERFSEEDCLAIEPGMSSEEVESRLGTPAWCGSQPLDCDPATAPMICSYHTFEQNCAKDQEPQACSVAYFDGSVASKDQLGEHDCRDAPVVWRPVISCPD